MVKMVKYDEKWWTIFYGEWVKMVKYGKKWWTIFMVKGVFKMLNFTTFTSFHHCNPLPRCCAYIYYIDIVHITIATPPLLCLYIILI